MASQGPLTTWLLAATPEALKRATTHSFLASAGRGTLPKTTLSQWLSQDRLYAQSYIRFIGQLLAKIRLDGTSTRNNNPSQQAISILIDALVNIRTELQFFETTAAQYDLDLTAISAEEGCGLTGTGGISTSAGISTTGSASCPGTTAAPPAAVEDPSGPAPPELDLKTSTAMAVQAEREATGMQRHRLCGTQGECQMQAGSELCSPPSVEREGRGPAPLAECEPCRPASGHPGMEEPVEARGSVGFAATRITRGYIDMFMSAGSAGVSLIEGLAVLWATEVCYLRAWRYAAAFLKTRKADDGKIDADGGALREKFIPNWSSVEFEEFVNHIGDVLDTLAGQIKGAEECEVMRARCLEWWRQVVWLEERFWPPMD